MEEKKLWRNFVLLLMGLGVMGGILGYFAHNDERLIAALSEEEEDDEYEE